MWTINPNYNHYCLHYSSVPFPFRIDPNVIPLPRFLKYIFPRILYLFSIKC